MWLFLMLGSSQSVWIFERKYEVETTTPAYTSALPILHLLLKAHKLACFCSQ
jgi:hypothetical protein